jgi:hypothetical protein
VDAADWQRFDGKVDRSAGPDGCWPWTGARLRSGGYGALRVGGRRGRTCRTHVLALERKLGRSLRTGNWALHTCDNPPCCNPAHLYEVTPSGNARDRDGRLRGKPPPVLYGGRNPRAVLPGAAAPTVAALVAEGASVAGLMRELKVGRTTAYRMLRKEGRWKGTSTT